MTDDPTTPLPDESPGEPKTGPAGTTGPASPASTTGPAGTAGTAGTDEAGQAKADGGPGGQVRRRRRLIIGGVIGAAVLLVLLGCLAVATVVRSGARLVERADENDRRHERLTESCLELETRLNRLIPPAATGGDPRRRADAIRDENAALRPLLTELEGMTEERGHRQDRRRADWASGWRQLVEARTAYADALDRQSTAGEPAFFVAPRTDRGDDAVVAALEQRGPDTCAGSIRRLGQPDL